MKTAEEIKKWLDEKKEFTSGEFIRWFETSDIDIPEGIRFVTANSRNNLLGLIFNEGKQILGFYDKEKVFQVFSYAYNINNGYCKEIPCKLVECKYEDLVVGDIFIALSEGQSIKLEKNILLNYDLFLGDNQKCYISNNTNIEVSSLSFISNKHFYKVVKK